MRAATFIALAILLTPFSVTVRPQPSPTTPGIQLANPEAGDVRFPVTVSQCEPVLIYHNTPNAYFLLIYTTGADLIRLNIPFGIGYLEWICNIPAGFPVSVGNYFAFSLVVQSGSSSSCLHNITTTYAYASHATSLLRSFTANPPTSTSLIYTGCFYSPPLSLCHKLTLLLERLFPSPLDPSQRSLSSTRPTLLV